MILLIPLATVILVGAAVAPEVTDRAIAAAPPASPPAVCALLLSPPP